jgi:hypothetical protein
MDDDKAREVYEGFKEAKQPEKESSRRETNRTNK